MKKLLGIIQGLRDPRKSLRERVFWIVLLLGTLVTFVTIFITIAEHTGTWAVISTIGCFLTFVGFFIAAVIIGPKEWLYMALCFALYFVILPMDYFLTGGISSGMPIYFLLCLTLATFGVTGKKKYPVFIIGLFALVITILLGERFPRYVYKMNAKDSVLDIILALVLCSVALCGFISGCVNMYFREQKRADELVVKLQHLSEYDELTHIYNRRMFYEKLKTEQNGNSYLCMLDIDDFKAINDKYGHLVGDQVLVEIASVINAEVSENNGEIAARFGGEEFVLVIYSDNPQEALERLERVKTRISEINIPAYPGVKLTASIGVARGGDDANSKEMLKRADDNMYEAKKNGKNLVVYR